MSPLIWVEKHSSPLEIASRGVKFGQTPKHFSDIKAPLVKGQIFGEKLLQNVTHDGFVIKNLVGNFKRVQRILIVLSSKAKMKLFTISQNILKLFLLFILLLVRFRVGNQRKFLVVLIIQKALDDFS